MWSHIKMIRVIFWCIFFHLCIFELMNLRTYLHELSQLDSVCKLCMLTLYG